MLCSSNEYCYKLETYLDAKPGNPKKPILPLESKVILNLLEVVEVPSDHEIFFDYYFLSNNLIKTLKKKGFRAVSAKENRKKDVYYAGLKE